MAKTKARIQSRRADARSSAEQRSLDAVAGSLELELIRIMASDARQNLTRPTVPDTLANQLNIRVAIDPNDTGRVSAVFDCSLQGNYAETPLPASPQESTIYVHAVFQAIYKRRSLDELSEEQLSNFGQTIGLLGIWPYWREFAQSMTTRMGLPPLTLPMIQARLGAAPRPIFGVEVPTDSSTKSRAVRPPRTHRRPKN
jgi:preprotein translocase subunit SecB